MIKWLLVVCTVVLSGGIVRAQAPVSVEDESDEDVNDAADPVSPASDDDVDADGDDAIDDDMADDDMADDDSDYSDEDDVVADPEEAEDDLVLDFEALGKMHDEDGFDSDGAMTGGDAAALAISESWTARSMELMEFHGYFRVRPNLYHKLYIRNDPALFPLDVDREAGCEDRDKCRTLAGADMRFLLAPTINLSEEVRIHSEFFFFDNLMMGSTPDYGRGNGATIAPGAALGFNQGGVPNRYFSMRRVWGEMEGALGFLRFGRMPSHWGTGMLYNAGDGLNDDHGDTVDRISFAFKLNGWTIMPAFDFPSEGVSLDSTHGRPFDVSQLDDAYRLVAMIGYIHEQEDQRAMLKRGDWLVNTGLHFSYRDQAMTFSYADPDDTNEIVAVKRGMRSIVPDVWFQLLYGTLHLELELAFNFGSVKNPSNTSVSGESLDVFGWGAVFQFDYGLLSDQLRLGLEFAIASGDRDVDSVAMPTSFDQNNNSSNHYSVFSFNPEFSVDRILYRQVLGSVAGTYYFKPWLRYDFLKSALGKQLGAQLDIIYSRAIYKDSTLGNSNHLGLEINAMLDFVTGDNFHTSLVYGVLFPMSGFKGTYTWEENNTQLSYMDDDLTIPQTLQLLMGITF